LWNATKALCHLIQKKKVDIAPCRAKIDRESMSRYLEFYNKKKQKIDCLARKRDLVARGIEKNNVRAYVSLESSKEERNKVQVQHHSQVQ
jgi:hypothetical protein